MRQIKRILLLVCLMLSIGNVAAQETTPEATAEAAPLFPLADDLTIAALQARAIAGSPIILEEALADGANYARYIASYLSEGYKIYGLLTIPFGDVPEGGFKAIVFNHGYIPPHLYVTTERYLAYVDNLARSGFVVFKIDMRGHGNSEGEAIGSYFSPTYTIDALAAFYSLQQWKIINPNGIGMWGHSMAGNQIVRAALVEPQIKAAVIWAGAVYSYADFERYAITDASFVRDPNAQGPRRGQLIMEQYGRPDLAVAYWQAVSLTYNIAQLQTPLQIHHSTDDDVVNVGYSRDFAAALLAANKPYEYYEYSVGGHNLSSPTFEQAMLRTIAFFQTYL